MAQHLLLLKKIQVSFLQPLCARSKRRDAHIAPCRRHPHPTRTSMLISPSRQNQTPICVKSSKQSILHSFLSPKIRMPSKRSLGCRHTFCISLDFGQLDFFTSSCPVISRYLYVNTMGFPSAIAAETSTPTFSASSLISFSMCGASSLVVSNSFFILITSDSGTKSPE
jgi:hypothetical protein